MARHLIPSDATLKAVRPGDPRKRLNDGDGLYLLLFVKGGAHAWRFDYSYHGRRKTISLGTYPDTSLALARRKADEARQLVAEDIDPSQKRKAENESWAQERIADEREAMRRIEARGVLETAHRALQDCSQALRYAVATGKAPSNPARDLKGAL